jgi:hypothetical protein
VVIDTSLPPGADVVLRTGDLDFDNGPGFRVLVGREINECWSIEAAYLGISDVSASASVRDTNSLAIPGDLGLASLDFFNAARFQVDYSTRLHSLELNLLRECDVREGCLGWCRRTSVLAGLRYLAWDEGFNIHPGDPDTGQSDYNIKTTNDLYGVQVGLQCDGERSCRRLGWDAVAKVGVYGNDAQQTQYVNDFPMGFLLRDLATQAPVSTSGTSAAFVGELGVAATARITDRLTARIGYNMLWVEGIALASNQLDFTFTPTSGTTLRRGGGAFLHGLTLGVEGWF